MNRYSFFEELEAKMLVPMQLLFNKELNNGDELIHTANAADNGVLMLIGFFYGFPD